MRTYPHPVGGWAGGLRLLAGLALLVACARPSPVAAQQARKYLIEASAGGVYQTFDSVTGLSGAPGGVARLGVWLPLNFSLEVEGQFAKAKPKDGTDKISVKGFGVSALYNFLIGARSSFYLKAGGGSTSYGSDCPRHLRARGPDLRQQRRAAGRGGLPGGGVAHRHDSGRRAGHPQQEQAVRTSSRGRPSRTSGSARA